MNYHLLIKAESYVKFQAEIKGCIQYFIEKKKRVVANKFVNTKNYSLNNNSFNRP